MSPPQNCFVDMHDTIYDTLITCSLKIMFPIFSVVKNHVNCFDRIRKTTGISALLGVASPKLAKVKNKSLNTVDIAI